MLQNQFSTYEDLLSYSMKVQYYLTQSNSISLEQYLEQKEITNLQFDNTIQKLVYVITGKIDRRTDEEIANDEELSQQIIETIQKSIKDKNFLYNKKCQQETQRIIKQICGDTENQGIIQANQIIFTIKQKLHAPQFTETNNLIDYLLLNKDKIVSELYYFNDLNRLTFGVAEKQVTAQEIIKEFSEQMQTFEDKYNISFKVALDRALGNIPQLQLQNSLKEKEEKEKEQKEKDKEKEKEQNQITSKQIQEDGEIKKEENGEEELVLPKFKDINYYDFISSQDKQIIREAIEKSFKVKVTSVVNWLQYLQNLVVYVQKSVKNQLPLAQNVFQLNNSDFHSSTSKIYFQLCGIKTKFTTINQLIAELTNKINLFSRKSCCGIQQILQYLLYDFMQNSNNQLFDGNKLKVSHKNYIMIRDEENKLIDSAVNIHLLALYDIYKVEDQLTFNIPYQSLNVLYYAVEDIDNRLKEFGYKEGCVLDRLAQYEQKMLKELYYCLFDKKTKFENESTYMIQRRIIKLINQFTSQYAYLNSQPIGYFFNKYLINYPKVEKIYQDSMAQCLSQSKFTKLLNQAFNQEHLTITGLVTSIKQLNQKVSILEMFDEYSNNRQLEFLSEFSYMLVAQQPLYKKVQDFSGFPKTYEAKLKFNCHKVISEYFDGFKNAQNKKREFVLCIETCQVMKKTLQMLGYDNLRTNTDILEAIQQLYITSDFLKSQLQNKELTTQGLIKMMIYAETLLKIHPFLSQKYPTGEQFVRILNVQNFAVDKEDDYRYVLDKFADECQNGFKPSQIYLLLDKKGIVSKDLLSLQRYTKEQQKQVYQQMCQLFIYWKLKYEEKFQSLYDAWQFIKQQYNNDPAEIYRKVEELRIQSLSQTADQSAMSQTSTASNFTQANDIIQANDKQITTQQPEQEQQQQQQPEQQNEQQVEQQQQDQQQIEQQQEQDNKQEQVQQDQQQQEQMINQKQQDQQIDNNQEQINNSQTINVENQEDQQQAQPSATQVFNNFSPFEDQQ